MRDFKGTVSVLINHGGSLRLWGPVSGSWQVDSESSLWAARHRIRRAGMKNLLVAALKILWRPDFSHLREVSHVLFPIPFLHYGSLWAGWGEKKYPAIKETDIWASVSIGDACLSSTGGVGGSLASSPALNLFDISNVFFKKRNNV